MSDEEQLESIVGKLPIKDPEKHQETVEKLKTATDRATDTLKARWLKEGSRVMTRMALAIDSTMTNIYNQKTFESFTGLDTVAFITTKLPFDLKRGASFEDVMRFMGRRKMDDTHYGSSSWTVFPTMQNIEFNVHKDKTVDGAILSCIFDESATNNLPKKFHMLLKVDTEFGNSSWCLFKDVKIEAWRHMPLGVDTLVAEEELYFHAKSCSGWNRVIRK